MTTLRYFWKEISYNVGRHRGTVAVAVMAVASTLVLLGLFLVVYLNLLRVVSSFQDSARVILYLRDGFDESRRDRLMEAVRKEAPGLKLQYVSHKDAERDFKRIMAGDDSILQGLGENPLPASIEVALDQRYADHRKAASLAQRLGRLDGVESVQYGREWLETLTRWIAVITYMAWALGGVLAVGGIVAVASAVRLSLIARSEEIEILRLIGATRRFIRAPFFAEGFIVGLVGGVFSVLILWCFFLILRTQPIPGGISIMEMVFLPPIWIAGLVAVGAAMGGLGTLLSIRRL